MTRSVIDSSENSAKQAAVQSAAAAAARTYSLEDSAMLYGITGYNGDSI